MRFAMLVIVLGFPLIDLYATVRVARWTGVPVYVWLGLAALAGLYLLRNERTSFRANTVAAMHGEPDWRPPTFAPGWPDGDQVDEEAA